MATTLKGRVRKVSLAFFGDEWKDAYVEFRFLTWSDAQAEKERNSGNGADADKYLEQAMETLQHSFVSGKCLNDKGELVELEAQDLKGFDIDALLTLYQRVLGVPDPNA